MASCPRRRPRCWPPRSLRQEHLQPLLPLAHSAELRPTEGWLPTALVHLSVARATKSPFATEMNLLPKRTAGTGPLATFGVVRCPGPSVYAFSNCGTKSPGETFSTSRQLLTSLSVAFFPRLLRAAAASRPHPAGQPAHPALGRRPI